MRFCWKGLNNHLIIHPLADPAFRTGHCHTYGLATWASVLSGLCNPFRRVHSTKHQQPHFNNRGKCMMDLCFLIKLKFCIWLTGSCTEGEKMVVSSSVCFQEPATSSWNQYSQWVFKHSTKNINSICSHLSPYPTYIWGIALASWMVRFCTSLYLISALWTNSSIVRKLLQNSCILASASLKRPGPLDQVAEPKTVDSSPSLSLFTPQGSLFQLREALDVISNITFKQVYTVYFLVIGLSGECLPQHT